MTIKTGWADVDALLYEADQVQMKLDQIREEAKDILYPAPRKESPDSHDKLKESA
ncbi:MULTISPECIES: hypothetical protein [Paenibacillus]|jgi:hypothetical protein|uniref:hypothetical protein n=1 Tax=Paenibacillus TaxID=44249 RepID=UPI0010D2436F|nr:MULTISPECIES: hypothetical protein [Paenibacillus]MBX4152484.1 hypothetical protein [Paenibacillus lautus]VTR32027.1 Uncharacterised protein [Actinobacillus pleuropneumoniae]